MVRTMRGELQHRLAEARALSDGLFQRLAPGALSLRPIGQRHRLIFYLGHLEAFDFNTLNGLCAGEAARHPAWEALFARGIDPLDDGPADAPEDWPSAQQLEPFRQELRGAVDALVARVPFEGLFQDGWALRLAIEHRLMHVETLCYLLGQLDGRARRDFEAPPPAVRAVPPEDDGDALLDIPAGTARLGTSTPFHGWDNEYPSFEVHVPAFRIQRGLVTNRRWLHFVQAGGYRDQALWTPEDWAWRQRAGLQHPNLWQPDGGVFLLRALSGVRPLPLDWPVYVSLAEARAYARWKGLQLPTEAQWTRAAVGHPDGRQRAFPWGDEAPQPGRHLPHGLPEVVDPGPVGQHPHGDSPFGLSDAFGLGWQWTCDTFAPHEGFRPQPFYPGYSQDFFDGQHFVLKGSGPATHTAMLRSGFRNWFQPHYPYVHAAVRCVA